MGLGTPPKRTGSALDKAFAAISLLLTLWLVGQVARDASWLTGLCFYIPSAFLAPLLIGSALGYALRNRRGKAALAAALALPPLGFVGLVENQFFRTRPPVPPVALRLVHWNTGGALGRTGSRAVLLDQHADLYVLSEVGAAEAVRVLERALGPPYRATVFGTMAVVGKGDVRPRGWVLNRGGAKVYSVAWGYAGRTADLLVIDLPSDILVPRGPILGEVVALVARHRPDLVVGDLNAPRRSLALASLPAGYRHAYETAGAGLGYTWPVPFPVYALDQCVHSPRVTPFRYDLGWSVHSDHCFQRFDFSLAERGSGIVLKR